MSTITIGELKEVLANMSALNDEAEVRIGDVAEREMLHAGVACAHVIGGVLVLSPDADWKDETLATEQSATVAWAPEDQL